MGKHKSKKKTSHKTSRKDDKDRGPRSSGYKSHKSSCKKKSQKRVEGSEKKLHKEQGQQGKISFLLACLFGLFAVVRPPLEQLDVPTKINTSNKILCSPAFYSDILLTFYCILEN